MYMTHFASQLAEISPGVFYLSCVHPHLQKTYISRRNFSQPFEKPNLNKGFTFNAMLPEISARLFEGLGPTLVFSPFSHELWLAFFSLGLSVFL